MINPHNVYSISILLLSFIVWVFVSLRILRNEYIGYFVMIYMFFTILTLLFLLFIGQYDNTSIIKPQSTSHSIYSMV